MDIAVAPPPAPATDDILRIFERQKQHQYVVARTGLRERIAKLRRLHDTVIQFDLEIKDALWRDFRKCGTEVDVSEIGCVTNEARFAMRNLQQWMAPRKVGHGLTLLGTSSEYRYEPKGVCLIISPWNFPVNLTLAPLVTAVAAGNCVIIKPSEYATHASAVIKKIVEACFPPEEVCVFEGGVEVSQELLQLPFNHIYYTGNPQVGKIVMKAAAEHLCSVTLELGGKSPVVVDETANLDAAAAKIVWLKCMNAGQTCIAPDYVLVHESVHDALAQKLMDKIKKFYGATPEAIRETPDFCRIVSVRHHKRVAGLLQEGLSKGARLLFGGATDESERYIEPTLLTEVPDNSALWEEEIFGPVLLLRPYRTLDEAIAFINSKPSALAMYLFSARKRNIELVLAETRNGDVTVNDCGVHFYNPELPFGGVNHSGIGKGHGEFAFREFSNARGILTQNRIFPQTNLFHPPYGSWLTRNLLKAVARWM